MTDCHRSRSLQDKFHEAVVNLTKRRVESNVRLGSNTHGPGDWDEIQRVEKAALEDEGVKVELAKLGLPEGTAVISDPWTYGTRSERACCRLKSLTLSRVQWHR